MTTVPLEVYRGAPGPPGSVAERGAGLQQRLEVAEDPGPAAAGPQLLERAGHHPGQPRRPGQLVGDGERGDAVLALLELVREPGEALGRQGRVHQHPERLDQPVRRIDLDDLTVDADRG